MSKSFYAHRANARRMSRRFGAINEVITSLYGEYPSLSIRDRETSFRIRRRVYYEVQRLHGFEPTLREVGSSVSMRFGPPNRAQDQPVRQPVAA